MNYKTALKDSMNMLAQDSLVRFIGYNVNHGSRAYGTLDNIPQEKCIETPVAENLMMGLATGMALEGFKPIVFFERHDFILNALDGMVNHLDKFDLLSHGQYSPKVIIRANVGAKGMLYPGPQHTQDFTEIFKKIVSFPVIELNNPQQIISEYSKAKNFDSSIMFIERRELFDID